MIERRPVLQPQTPRPPRDRGQDRLRRLTWAARLAIAWEEAWRGLWPVATALAAFLALALTDWLPLLPGWLHALLLVAAAGGIAWLALRGAARLLLPTRESGHRRLERARGLAHRPIEAAADRLALGADDPAAQVAWARHQTARRADLGRLGLPLPRPGIARHDARALRFAVLLALILAALAAGDDIPGRLLAAVMPDWESRAGLASARLELWADPPAYTHLPPIFLTRQEGQAQAAEPIAIPAGAMLQARVSQARRTPTLEANGADTRLAKVEGVGGHDFTLALPLTGGTRVRVRDAGRTLGQWAVTVVADQPPTVAFTADPSGDAQGLTKLPLKASDDYGLAGLAAIVRIDPLLAKAGKDAVPETVELPLGDEQPREIASTLSVDLTANPWAGLPALVRLVATDASGRTGESEEVSFTLPERRFKTEAARALIAARKRLTLDPDGAHRDVGRVVSEVALQPQTYGGRSGVFLALHAAAAGLGASFRLETLGDLQALLWDVAVAIDDGGAGDAARKVAQARDALKQALKNPEISKAEIDKRTEALKDATREYMQALNQDLQNRMARGEDVVTIPPELADQLFSSQDMEKMLDEMRDMAESGAREGAEAMLDKMEQMMDGAEADRAAPLSKEMIEAFKAMRDLADITKRQKALLERNQQRQAGKPRPGQEGQESDQPADAQKDAAEQDALAKQLSDVTGKFSTLFGDAPEQLGDAEAAMRNAGRALKNGKDGQAAVDQQTAVEKLTEGEQNGSAKMAQRMTGMVLGMTKSPGGQESEKDGERDPLGHKKEGNGKTEGSEVKIPDQAERQKARDILDELRRRLGERERSAEERDYLHRLLRQF